MGVTRRGRRIKKEVNSSNYTPRRSSARLKSQRPMNYIEVEEDDPLKSFTLSASSHLPSTTHLPSQDPEVLHDGDSFEILHDGFDSNAEATSARNIPIRGSQSDHEGSTPNSPNKVALLDDEVLHNASDANVNATSDHEVPIRGVKAHNHSATKTINITEMVDEVDDDLSDIDSGLGSAVSVEGYRVKPHYAEILRAIISKHGDIGTDCSLKSVSVRSLSMELLCQIVHELKESDLLRVTKDRITEMQTSVSDLERQNIEVGWLKTRLDKILAAKHAIPILKQSSGVRMLRDQRKAKVIVLRERVNAALQELSRAESEAVESDLIISECRAKLKEVVELGTLIKDLV